VDRAGLRALHRRLAETIEPAEDGVKYIPLCQACAGKVEIIGQGCYVEPDAEYEVL